MPRSRAAGSAQCLFRSASARCVFVDGHPGAHVCVGGNSPHVAVRGLGPVPEAKFLARAPTVRRRPRVAAEPGRVTSENIWGGWTDGMVRHLLSEMHEAGVSSPYDWVANIGRLRQKRSRP